MAQAETPQQIMQNAVDALLILAQSAADIAHARRNIFEAYKSEGFTDEQALELTKLFGGGAF